MSVLCMYGMYDIYDMYDMYVCISVCRYVGMYVLYVCM